MNGSQIYIVISIVVLAAVALLVFFVGKNKDAKRFTSLARLAFGFILAGLFLERTGSLATDYWELE